jgi:hypothetical protein
MGSTVVSPRGESQGCAHAPRMVRWRIDGLAHQHDWLAAEPALPSVFARKVTAWNRGSQLSLPCNSILPNAARVGIIRSEPIDKAQWSKLQNTVVVNQRMVAHPNTCALHCVQFGSCMHLWKPSTAASISPACAIRGRAPVESDCTLLEEDCEGGHPLPPPYNNPVSSRTYARVWHEARGKAPSEVHLASGSPRPPPRHRL